MIPVILNRAVRGRGIAEALASTGEEQCWKVKRYSDTVLAPGSVKKVEVNRGVEMQIPLGERQTRFSRVKETLLVGVNDLGENDIKTVDLAVYIREDSISRIVPRSNTKKILMVVFCAFAASVLAMVSTALAIYDFTWWLVGLAGTLSCILFVMTMLAQSGGTTYDISLDGGYKKIEPKINALLLNTFSKLGQS